MPQQPPVPKYAPVGHCIYCGKMPPEVEKLTPEHVIAYGLNGNHVLPEASCPACADITSAVETVCLRDMLLPIRAALGMKTRHAKNRPDALPVFVITEQGEEKRQVPIDSHPLFVCMPQLGPPGMLLSATPQSTIQASVVTLAMGVEYEKALAAFGQDTFRIDRAVRPDVFAHMIAKIAHASAVAFGFLGKFEPLLPELILGNASLTWHLVGGDLGSPATPPSTELHEVGMQWYSTPQGELLVANVRLFAFLGAPTYFAVVGRRHAPDSQHQRAIA